PSPPLFVHDEAQVKIYFGHHNPDAAMAHMRRMREFDLMRADQLEALVEEMKARGESPFHKVLVEIGQQLSAFKATMFVKLEKAMARELTMITRGKAAAMRKPLRAATVRR
ncbi:MAG TPA: hypothetical protein VKR29_00360, partial [Candidatus Binataceae bacterium]|nr:hypothetical protein [Candidatus Binataceae bacterium]